MIKKRVVLLLAMSFSTQAALAEGIENFFQNKPIPFYVGGQLGWAYAHNSGSSLQPYNFNAINFSHNNFTAGVFGGYIITRDIAAEIGYQYFAGARLSANGTTDAATPFYVDEKIPANTLQFLGRFSIPIWQNLYGIVKAGGVYIHESAVRAGTIIVDEAKNNFRPIVAAGAEYKFSNFWGIDGLYTHIFGTDTGAASYDALSAGITLYYNE